MSDFESVPAVPSPEESEEKTIVNNAPIDWESEPPAKEPDFAALESEAEASVKENQPGDAFAASSESFSSAAGSVSPKNDKKKTWIIIAIIAAVLLLCCCVSLIILIFALSSAGTLDYLFELPYLLTLV